MTIGFVFKADEELFLTKYLGNGEFSDGFPISNNEPYEDLDTDQLALVGVKEVHRGNGDIAFIIKDYHFITIGNEDRDNIRGCDILLDKEAREGLAEMVVDQAKELGIEL